MTNFNLRRERHHNLFQPPQYKHCEYTHKTEKFLAKVIVDNPGSNPRFVLLWFICNLFQHVFESVLEVAVKAKAPMLPKAFSNEDYTAMLARLRAENDFAATLSAFMVMPKNQSANDDEEDLEDEPDLGRKGR